jgi:hypothetical protein
MDSKYFEEIKAREQAATPRPWKMENNPKGSGFFGTIHGEAGVSFSGNRADNEFIAHARTDIPELIAEVERLTEENEELAKNGGKYIEISQKRYEMFEKASKRAENAEIERDALKKDKEFCLSTAKYNAEFYDEAKEENATLKKALELACKHISAHEDCLCTQEIAHKECHDWDGNCDEKGCWKDYFIHQAQQTHETQEVEK